MRWTNIDLVGDDWRRRHRNALSKMVGNEGWLVEILVACRRCLVELLRRRFHPLEVHNRVVILVYGFSPVFRISGGWRSPWRRKNRERVGISLQIVQITFAFHLNCIGWLLCRWWLRRLWFFPDHPEVSEWAREVRGWRVRSCVQGLHFVGPRLLKNYFCGNIVVVGVGRALNWSLVREISRPVK